MKIKTADLIDKALDYAVALCKGSVTELTFDGIAYGFDLNGKTVVLAKGWAPSMSWHPSTNWSQGGLIIEQEHIHWGMCEKENNMIYLAYRYKDGIKPMKGPTPLIASMRCYVASKLGDEVEIPEELL